MNRTLFTLLTLTLATNMSAARENGIYVIANEDPQITTTSGAAVGLGNLTTNHFGNVSIWSLSNDNERFRLMLDKAGPFNPQEKHAIWIADVCERIASYYEPDHEGRVTAIIDIQGRAAIEKIADALEVQVQLREHPGHQLRIDWKPTQESFRVGEPIVLELVITNVGQTTVRFIEGGQQRGPRDNQFRFVAFAGDGRGASVPDTGSSVNFGGKGVFRTLEPGAVFRKRVDLSKWFQFKNPDTYLVTGIYELELAPPDFGPRTLWHELVAGQCRVRVIE